MTQVVDPDDLAYIAARDQLGLRAVYTRDGHLERMSSLVVNDQIDLFLRDYARASAVKIGITLGSTTACVLSIETIPLLYRLLTSGISWIRRQSTGMQLAIVGIALALAIHPKSRAKFAQAWRSIAPTISRAARSTVLQLMCDYAEALRRKGKSVETRTGCSTSEETHRLDACSRCVSCEESTDELLALKWTAVNFEQLCMKIEEGVVHGRIGPVKTGVFERRTASRSRCRSQPS